MMVVGTNGGKLDNIGHGAAGEVLKSKDWEEQGNRETTARSSDQSISLQFHCGLECLIVAEAFTAALFGLVTCRAKVCGRR